MANKQQRYIAYQEALSIIKAHAHFGESGGPILPQKYSLKAVYDKMLLKKEDIVWH